MTSSLVLWIFPDDGQTTRKRTGHPSFKMLHTSIYFGLPATSRHREVQDLPKDLAALFVSVVVIANAISMSVRHGTIERERINQSFRACLLCDDFSFMTSCLTGDVIMIQYVSY